MPHRGSGRRATVLVAGVDPRQLPAARLRASRRSRRGSEERRANRWPYVKTGGRGVVRARRGPHARLHDHRLRTRPIGARRLSRSSARLLQRPVRVRAARGPRRRADRGHARAAAALRCARTGASRRRSPPAKSTSAASAPTAPEITTSCSTIRSRSATSRASSSRPAGVPHHLVVAGRFESDLDRVAADLAADLHDADRVLRPARSVRSVLVSRLGRRRGLRRARASRVDEPDLQPRRLAEGRRGRHSRATTSASSRSRVTSTFTLGT